MDLVEEILGSDLTDEEVAALVANLPARQFEVLQAEVLGAEGTAGQWAYDPSAYIQERLGEGIWSIQQKICESIRDHPRTSVPAGFGGGKSHLASRIALWWVESWPVGTALVVTTATTHRSVKGQLWGHIRRLHRRHRLPGRCNQTDWWIGDEQVALGFAAEKTSPEDVTGWHAPHMLVIVDEAGGITHEIGAALESLVAAGHARILAIGNPSMDEQDTWFERISSSRHWNTITLPVRATPNYTGEEPGICRSCPAGVRAHSIRTHLVAADYVAQTSDTWGEDSAWYQAKVDATFPDVVANTLIPMGWLQESKHAEVEVGAGARVRLGVDVASDGGDELAIARAEGMTVRLVHHSAGKHLANAVDVAGMVLAEIHAAQKRAEEIGSTDPVRVKIDSVGVGYGVASMLEKWAEEGVHEAVIVRVEAAGSPHQPERFVNARSEMHWTLREAIQCSDGNPPEWRLDVDDVTLKQLAGPRYWATSSGKIMVEPKEQMRKRKGGAGNSPDRGDAVSLAVYEPAAVKPKKRKLRIVA